MIRPVLPLAALLAALACAASAAAPPAPAAPSAAPADSLPPGVRAVLEPLLEEFPGIGYAIGRGDRVIHAGGLGWADAKARRPVDADTRFRLYSAIKPVTATAALVLAGEDGLLDAPVSTWLPELPPAIGATTPRMLIGHLAGIRDYRRGEWMAVSRRHCDAAADALPIFAADPLVAEPGARHDYTTFGYVLLSAAIEAATGRSLADVLAETVLGPAGAAGIAPDGSAPTAVPYEPAGDGVRPARAVDNSCRAGAGGYAGRAADLARFGLAFAAGELVDVDRALAPMTTADGEPTGYAFGWGVGTDAAGRRVAAHSGSGIGGRSAVFLVPDERLVVVLLANMDGESLVDEARAIAALLLDG